ncbi:hypothetical protein [Sporolactobacillus putidus]|uniref:Uncharacterized protein n=1 Tax=Sporolactobacillus putidus TaxID=492735 RepID=A0A917S763_9BACL|nr:hypothetical protein [Sporolactobacillus putidus]GGL62542.1 hypothetical protein GCM10007968_28190 [Sporolactobacillus putidus]
MIGYSLQLILCYGITGLMMGWMLGLLPFWQTWKKRHVAAFLFLIIAWLPVAILALFAAPFVNLIGIKEETEL